MIKKSLIAIISSLTLLGCNSNQHQPTRSNNGWEVVDVNRTIKNSYNEFNELSMNLCKNDFPNQVRDIARQLQNQDYTPTAFTLQLETLDQFKICMDEITRYKLVNSIIDGVKERYRNSKQQEEWARAFVKTLETFYSPKWWVNGYCNDYPSYYNSEEECLIKPLLEMKLPLSEKLAVLEKVPLQARGLYDIYSKLHANNQYVGRVKTYCKDSYEKDVSSKCNVKWVQAEEYNSKHLLPTPDKESFFKKCRAEEIPKSIHKCEYNGGW